MRMSSQATGIYVPGYRVNPFFTARTPQRLYRHPSGLRAFVPATLNLSPQLPGSAGIGDLVRATLNAHPQLPGSAGIGGLGCSHCSGMGDLTSMMTTVQTDFSAMMAGTAPWTTYALYGGGAIAAFYLISSMGGSTGGRRRR